MNDQLVAHLHSLCVFIIVTFHTFLILGKPWGHLTMAGKYQGVLPAKMRVFSGISILILLSITLMVEVSVGNVLLVSKELGQRIIIVPIVFNIIQVILHIITPSKWERILWLPLLTVMLACSLGIYFGL